MITMNDYVKRLSDEQLEEVYNENVLHRKLGYVPAYSPIREHIKAYFDEIKMSDYEIMSALWILDFSNAALFEALTRFYEAKDNV